MSGLAATAALAFGTAALYQGLVIRQYVIPTSKWQCGRRLRFAVVSDLHCTLYGKNQCRLVKLIARERPDFLLLPGDIVDQYIDPAGAQAFLQRAGTIAPTYYAPGNHEYRTGHFPGILRMIQGCGVRVLLGESVALETKAGPLLLAGCEDTERQKYFDASYDHAGALRRQMRGIKQETAFTLLLAHRPELYFLYEELGFDLVVSGHAHGGQLRIPFLCNGVIAPGQGLFPRYAGGCYKHGHMHHVVSRGTSLFPSLPRVFNPPEIVIVDVVGSR